MKLSLVFIIYRSNSSAASEASTFCENVLYEKNLFEKVYLICSKKNDNMASKIISLSKNKYFINCSKYDLANIMGILKKSSFFVGNNSATLFFSRKQICNFRHKFLLRHI